MAYQITVQEAGAIGTEVVYRGQAIARLPTLSDALTVQALFIAHGGDPSDAATIDAVRASLEPRVRYFIL